MNCLLCQGNSFKPTKGAVGYVCSICVQILLTKDPKKLNRAFVLAKQKGLGDKARALELFLEEGVEQSERKIKVRQISTRGRAVRAFGNKARVARQVEE